MTIKHILISGLLGLLSLSSCRTLSVSLEVLKPAAISVPSNIKTIAVANRTSTSRRERARNILEGIITGEAPFVDRHAAEQCVNGVFNQLKNSPRFSVVIPGNTELKGTGTREFPEPLDWDNVSDICKNNKADALLVLEVFDSNNKYSNSSRLAKRKEGDKEISYTEYSSNLNIQIYSGWRIYDPINKIIVDQDIYTDPRSWNSTSDSPRKAQYGLPLLENAVSDAGYSAGQQYAIRISPQWNWVSRMYYKKGNPDFEMATRRAQAKDWNGAAELWEKHTKNPDPKLAGWACYNMALVSEINGDLENALSWAKRAYVDYNNKNALYYMNTLQNRINDENRLKFQMGE